MNVEQAAQNNGTRFARQIIEEVSAFARNECPSLASEADLEETGTGPNFFVAEHVETRGGVEKAGYHESSWKWKWEKVGEMEAAYFLL
jgi:hypothetical protein